MAKIKIAFFVTYMPRSGSQWLTKLLDCNTSGVQVHHLNLHTYACDILYNENMYYGRTEKVREYLGGWRWEYIQREGGQRSEMLWGDVCERHRYAVPLLRKMYPGVPIAGLIRDGRESARSLVRRGFHTLKGWPSAIQPLDAETGAAWATMTVFEKNCWEWADAYRRLREQGVTIYRLEDLNESYEAVCHLCEQLNIEVPREKWNECAGKRVDAFRPISPVRFSDEQERAFQRWAGDVHGLYYREGDHSE